MRQTNIRTNGTQMFNIPNNEEGRFFIKLVQKFLNSSKYKISSRGRAKRRRLLAELDNRFYNRSDIPIAQAEWIALYVKNKQNPFP